MAPARRRSSAARISTSDVAAAAAGGRRGSTALSDTSGNTVLSPGEEKEREEKRKKDQQVRRTELRIKTSATGTGLQDWCFNASLLVQDCVEEYSQEVEALQKMLETIHAAAHVLSDDNWRRFNELIWDRVHCQDQEVHGALFAKVEPTWRSTLTTPKGGQTCVFLHIGTEPPSGQLVNMLTKLGWFGVSVSPVPPESGSEDLVQHIKLDCSNDRDRDGFVGLMSPTGGLLPKPGQFLLAFVNAVFNPLDPDPDSDEELGAYGGKDEESDLSDFGEDEGKPGQPPTASWIRAAYPVAAHSSKARQCSTASGYGKLGVTRYPNVRKRLRALNLALGTCLTRLKQGGSIVIFWPGLPIHPMMFFLTAQLRTLFLRVHVLAADGIKTFETYILCASFNRDKAMESVPGEGGSGLRSFFVNAYRRAALDDVLLWTLPTDQEREEALFGLGGQSRAKTYEDLWNQMATKYKTLAADLDLDVTKIKTEVKEEKRSSVKPKAEAGKKGDKSEPTSPKAEAKAKAKAKAEPKAEAKAEVKAEAKADIADAKADDTPAVSPKAAKGKSPKAKAKGSPKAKSRAARAEEPKEEAKEEEAKAESRAGSRTHSKDDQPAPTKEEAKAVAAEPSPALPPVGEAAAKPDEGPQSKPQESKDKGKKAQVMTVSEAVVKADGERTPKKRARPQFVLSRSVPALSGSLGAVPGSLGITQKDADRFRMAEQFAFIKFGVLCAEKKIDVRKWHRPRDGVGVSLAGDGVHATASATGGSFPGGAGHKANAADPRKTA